MVAAQGQVKEYSRSVQEVYLPCLEKDKVDAIAALDATDPEYAAKKQSIDNMHARSTMRRSTSCRPRPGAGAKELKAFKAAGEKK